MKQACMLIAVFALAACSSTASLNTSVNGLGDSSSPTDPSDPRLHHRSFYLDHDETPAWMKASPLSNR